MNKFLLITILAFTTIEASSQSNITFDKNKKCIMIEAGKTFDDKNIDRNELRIAIGFPLNRYLRIGGGLGLDYHKGKVDDDYFNQKNNNTSYTTAPIFGNARLSYPVSRSFSPFSDIKAGYAANLTGNDSDGGIYGNGSLGVRFNVVTLSAGYTLQKLGDRYNWVTGKIGPRKNSNGFTFRVGIEL